MQYDWSGVRTRRIRRLKLTMGGAFGLLMIVTPVALLPGVDLTPLVELVSR